MSPYVCTAMVARDEDFFRVFRILKSGGGGGEHNRYGAKVANSIENCYK